MRGTVRTILLAAMATILVEPLSPPPARAAGAPGCLDVALVLAVDASGSVSAGEYRLQRDGIAAAFRDPVVVEALSRAGRVAVSVLFWGAERQARPQSDWVVVTGGQGADRFAGLVEAMPRQVSGDTALGAGVMAAIEKLATLDGCAVRKIVNVSGDGEETRALRGQRRAMLPADVRDLAETLHVEINGLAIGSDDPDLSQYYAANVITGPDAFVMQARGYGDFAVALRRKLIREISPRVVAGMPGSPPAGAVLR